MRDIWAVVSAIAGVLAVAVAVVVFVLGRSEQAKALDIELVSRSTLVDQRLSQTEGRLELLYEGRKISNYAILQLRVINAGGQPIRAADYEAPIRVQFSETEEVLSALSKHFPHTLKAVDSLRQGLQSTCGND